MEIISDYKKKFKEQDYSNDDDNNQEEEKNEDFIKIRVDQLQRQKVRTLHHI